MRQPAPTEPNQQLTDWQRVEAVLLKHHHQPDLQAARIVYAAVAAHRLPGSPVWPMLVAPPGSMKTELLGGMDGLPTVHFIDSISPQTFISGQIAEPGDNQNKKSASLLHRIGKHGIIVYPDFSTVLGMKSESKATILADMRRIYDGQLRKEYGTADDLEHREWKGRITFIVAVTPDIDGYYSVFQTLGERFVMVRWPRAGGIEAALAAMNQNKEEAKRELKEAVSTLLGNLPNHDPRISTELQRKIAALTEIAVRGRTHVPRSGYNKDIIYVPEAESATRLAQQLCQVAKGLASLDHREAVTEHDYRLVQRAAFDCMPPTRASIFKAIMTRRDVAELKLPKSTRHYALEELAAQDLILKTGDGQYHLSDLASEHIAEAGYNCTLPVTTEAA
jgi:hypothetical protein